MDVITDISNFTKQFSNTIQFGQLGTVVDSNLDITDESTIRSNMNTGWFGTGAAIYQIENISGAYGGYIFDQEYLIESVDFYIGRFTNQNKTLQVETQYYDGENWITKDTFDVTTTIPYPVNVFTSNFNIKCWGIRWIHNEPLKTLYNGISFFGMIMRGRIAAPSGGGFSIDLQYSASDRNVLDKDITLLQTITGRLREPTSIIDPIIVIQADLTDLINCNYLTISTFGRSYFVNNVRSIRNGLLELTCHVDVLSSFKTQIRANTAIVSKQENDWNLYLNDGSIQVYAGKNIYTKPFPNGFNTFQFVLAVAG